MLTKLGEIQAKEGKGLPKMSMDERREQYDVQIAKNPCANRRIWKAWCGSNCEEYEGRKERKEKAVVGGPYAVVREEKGKR